MATCERMTMTVREAAVFLGLSKNSAWAAVKRGEIPSVRVGRRVLIPVRRLEEMLERTKSETDHGAAARGGA